MNKTLPNILGFYGEVEDFDILLYRGDRLMNGLLDFLMIL